MAFAQVGAGEAGLVRDNRARPGAGPADRQGLTRFVISSPLGSGAACFVGQEAVADLRIVTVRVGQRVRTIRLPQHGIGHRLVQPAVAGLSGGLQHPARGHDGHPAPAGSFTSGQVLARQMR
ncbi:hypothetical protein [Streptomyces sp. NPDC014676]|uniref:hypothetical protein n=1 Tax=Streptomyces sp. NPDC014676 TaxID=3364879 RepID=UPI003700F1B9